MPPQAEAPPIDKEGTLRNTDWPEADRTRKTEVRIPISVDLLIGVGVLCLFRNKRLTLPIMTRFDDVNKKEQKGATLATFFQTREPFKRCVTSRRVRPLDLLPRLRQFVRRYYSSLTRLRFRGLFFVSPSSALVSSLPLHYALVRLITPHGLRCFHI
ncbi:hypothetical protein T05_4865 [Trichinella murrelli]|uniref:Uncharacterized protein n=1 Tax=Trichinella murrelli TaxID=144512 RepID=A0A0V0U8C8_9BILA|nr:hypothetical protein T05_4865 [Trichinella murrelli]